MYVKLNFYLLQQTVIQKDGKLITCAEMWTD